MLAHLKIGKIGEIEAAGSFCEKNKNKKNWGDRSGWLFLREKIEKNWGDR